MSFLKSVGLGSTLGAIAGGLALGPAGALIGAGLGGLSSYTTSAQNKANQKALDRSNQYDYWLWQNSNEYNSPVQQMQRLAQAGLNPNLVYGSGSVTGNTSGVANSNGVAPLTAQDYAKNSLGNYQSLLTAKQMEENITNTQRTNTNLLRQGNNLNWQGLLEKKQYEIARHNLDIAQERHTFVNDGGKWTSIKGLGTDIGRIFAGKF